MTPDRIAVNEATGDVYVIDKANDLINRFDRDGTFLSQISGTATTTRTFGFGGDEDIAIDNSVGGSGNIYLNTGYAKFFGFRGDGDFLWEVAGVSQPCGVAVDTSGNFFGSDYGGGVQQRSAADGSLVGSPIVAPGDAGDTCHLAFDGSRNLYLHRWDTNTLQRLVAPSYTFPGTTLPDSNYTDVEVNTTTGRAYAPASGVGLRWFNPDGSSAGFSLDSDIPGRNYVGIAVNSRTNRMYITDSNNRTVEIWESVWRLTITKTGAGRGTVRSDDGSIDCGSTCSGRFVDDALARLTVTADAGSRFNGWTLASGTIRSNTCTSTATPCELTALEDINLVANFSQLQRRVSVRIAGTGSGTVRSTPTGITCGLDCSELFNETTGVSLAATPAPGSTFAGWSGVTCTGGAAASPCAFTVGGSDIAVTATFAQTSPTAATGGTSGITETTATIAGSVNPNGAATSCVFEYGLTTSYGSTAPCSPDPGSGTAAVDVSAALSGLIANTEYHYRVTGRNAGGTTSGADGTFRTAAPRILDPCVLNPLSCPPPPPQPGVLKLDSTTAQVTGTSAAVKLSCDGGTACRGAVTLTARIRGRARRGRRARARTVTAGTASYDIAAGRSATVSVRLSRTIRSLISKSGSVATTLRAGELERRLVLKGRRARARRRGSRARGRR